MKVILLTDIKGVGKKDQILNASDGYARNYLLPKKMAVEANDENRNKLKAKQASFEHKKGLEKEQAKQTAQKMNGILLKLPVKAGENGKIFGGVTAKEIADNLSSQYNITIDKKKIELKETIKTIGTQEITVKLYDGVVGKLKIDIIPQ